MACQKGSSRIMLRIWTVQGTFLQKSESMERIYSSLEGFELDWKVRVSFERLRGRRKSRCSFSSPLITYLPRGGERMASRKDDGRCSFGQEMWTSLSLAPRRTGPHWAQDLSGEWRAPNSCVGFGGRIKEAGFTFMNLSVKWSGSLLLLPLPSGKTLSFVGNSCLYCAVRVLRLGA